MTKKSVIVFVCVLLLAATGANSQTKSSSTIQLMLSGYSTKVFSTVPVTDSEIDKIIECGIKAPSARNSQLWYFTVVKDAALMKEIIPDVNNGNVLIIVSGIESKERGINVDFDCALAVQNMYIGAQSIKLGSHIYTGPVENINAKLKDKLNIPKGYRVVAVLRIGNVASGVDAVTSASTRKSKKDLVNYR
jgi:nitroreductase